MTSIRLEFVDADETVLWWDDLPAPVTFAMGELVHLSSIVLTGYDHLWDAGLTFRGEYQVVRVEQSFTRQYGLTVASVKSMMLITVVVSPVP